MQRDFEYQWMDGSILQSIHIIHSLSTLDSPGARSNADRHPVDPWENPVTFCYFLLHPVTSGGDFYNPVC